MYIRKASARARRAVQCSLRFFELACEAFKLFYIIDFLFYEQFSCISKPQSFYVVFAKVHCSALLVKVRARRDEFESIGYCLWSHFHLQHFQYYVSTLDVGAKRLKGCRWNGFVGTK
jgi:hypothetical protein